MKEVAYKYFFLFFPLAAILFIKRETILAILVGSHLGNIPVKFESYWSKGLEGVDDGRRMTDRS